ncbi:MAG: OmpA family protein [Myxococcales bacterium]|nr:OmpA family protein [Myxococcales bacterium]
MKKALPFVLLLSLAAGCGIPKEQWEQKLRENADLQTKVADLEKQKTKLEQEIADLKKEKADLQRTIDNLKDSMGKLGKDKADLLERMAKLSATLEDLERAKAAADKRSKAFRDLLAKFKAMMDAGKLQVEVRNGQMLVKLPDNILFDPGKTELKKEGQEAIAQVTRILGSIEGRKFQVAGHTDNVPTGKNSRFKSNWELSSQRALTVLELMIKEGMDAKRLSAAGYADVLPVATNDSDDGKRQNRRIEIVLQPNIEDLPGIDEKQ